MSNYLIPDPLQSDRQFTRFYHQDIPNMETEDLIDELNHLRAHLFGEPKASWLRGRVRALEAETSKRRGNTDYKFSRPKLAGGVKL